MFCSYSQSFTIELLPSNQVSITARWMEAERKEKFTRHFYTWPVVGIKSHTSFSWDQCPVHLATCSHACGRVGSVLEAISKDLRFYSYCWLCVGQTSLSILSLSTQQWYVSGGPKMTSCGNQITYLLFLRPMPCPLGHIFPCMWQSG